MKSRVLWVDDEVKFGREAELERQGAKPRIFGYLLHPEARPNRSDSRFTVEGSETPATYLDLHYEATFIEALELVQKKPFDLAILDVRLRTHAENEEKFQAFLASEGLTGSLKEIQEKWGRGVAEPLIDMMTSFYLWRELVKRNRSITVFFYTLYADTPDTLGMLPYRPFINPGCQLPLAIYRKFSDELSEAVRNFLDSQAMDVLTRVPYSKLEELQRGLTAAVESEDVLRQLKRTISSSAVDSDVEATYCDIFPELALDCHFPSPDRMKECKPKVLDLIDKALASHQVCKIVARLHNARYLEWGGERPLGLELVREFRPQSASRAWSWESEAYSPLELISHPPDPSVEVKEADIELWNSCRQKANEQIRSVEGYLPREELSDLQGLFDVCDEILPPEEKRIVINRFKNSLRWSPQSVFKDLGIQGGTKYDFGNLPIGRYAIIAGSEKRIRLAMESFLADLRDHRCIGEIVYGYAAADDLTDRARPRLLWMAIWGKKGPSSQWPPVGGSKITSGTNRLKGTLACYSISLEDGEFRADLLPGSSELTTPCSEFAQMKICVETNRICTEALVGFAFVLQGYPKRDT